MPIEHPIIDRLVLLVGSEAAEILDPRGPLARFAPGKLDKVVPLKNTQALESYADSATPVPVGKGNRFRMLVPRLKELEGTVEASDADLPMIIRATRGFGQIVFVAADLDRAPLNRWKDRGTLVAKLLGLPVKPSEEASQSTAIMQLGFDDVSGQLRSALDQFTGVRLIPFGLVVAGIFVYILLIGPGDFFLLRRLRRMEWTWLTFPLLVIVFSAGAYWLAYQLKGDQLRLNQVDLVDVDTSSGLVRGTTWVNLFSPRAESYNLSLRPKLPDGSTVEDADVLLSWLGLPGTGLGGMDSRTTGSAIWRRSYDFAPRLDAIEGMPIQVWSTKSVTARWHARWEDCLRADLTREVDLPSGRIVNSLPLGLQNCLLVYDRWVYQLGTLEPGQFARIDSLTERTELKTLLTDRRMVPDEKGDKIRRQATPYDTSSDNIPYILRTMMFFDAAGGSRYTHLSNRYQPFVDLSDLLGPDRAILVAVGPDRQSPGAELLRDGKYLDADQNRHVTMYRFVFPVTEKEEGSRQ